MTTEEIIADLRAHRGRLAPVEMAELFFRHRGRRSQSDLFFTFLQAFPALPVGTMKIASGLWVGATGGPLTNQEFNERLNPWLGEAPPAPGLKEG